MLNTVIHFFLHNKLIAYLLVILIIGWGLAVSPFDFGIQNLPRDPVAVDAIPDIGENQQIVYTKWNGRSPQDVEDQITYPLTSALLGITGVKSVRSNSMFGFSSIYIIFNEDVEFYWSRSRILEKLNSLPTNLLPKNVQPSLGPDATALGQIFWYTLEGYDSSGSPAGGWDLHELRSVQDFYVRHGLSATEGVAEVASIGGFVREYQVDVDPQKMKAYNIDLNQVMIALKKSNLDVGAQTMEINMVEYFVRGLGYIQNLEDIEQTVVESNNHIPITIRDIAHVHLGPANRRGVLDKSGAEAVGGVVVARYGSNPMEVIDKVKEKIMELDRGLPSKTLEDGTVSKIRIVPFYDRTQLINETLGTLREALSLEILITIIVVILMLFNLRASLIVSFTLPIAVLLCFIAMKYFNVDANIVALSGIAIAIGTMVDMGIVLIDNILRHMEESPPDQSLITTIYNGTIEVASAVVTALTTTVISFLPVFTMIATEGKLFKPLAYTKTFALISAIIVALVVIPAMAHTLFKIKLTGSRKNFIVNGCLVVLGIVALFLITSSIGVIIIAIGLLGMLTPWIQSKSSGWMLANFSWIKNGIYALVIIYFLSGIWMPLGADDSVLTNFFFVAIISLLLISVFHLIIRYYEQILRVLLRFKIAFLLVVLLLLFLGYRVFKSTGQEFIPALDEGSFLLMPTSMPYAGMQENIKNLKFLDMAVTAIPEVETVVGKAGRVESALDPAPLSMYENVIIYKTEYRTNAHGKRIRYKVNKQGQFLYDEYDKLVEDKNGQYFRQWRDHIKSPNDIWAEITEVTQLPGVTSAPKLQPIQTRLIMLQTGMRSPMGIKIKGNDIASIEAFGLLLAEQLKNVDGVKKSTVYADRIVGKPYLNLRIDRQKINRYGLSIEDVQHQIQAAIGGMLTTTTVEGRERYDVRVRYPRDYRNQPDDLKNIYVATKSGEQVLLGELVSIEYEAGPQALKSEDGFLVSYVLFDKDDGFAEGNVVQSAQDYLDKLIENGSFDIPAGVSYRFAGNYENQIRANNRLSLVVPLALLLIFFILYFHFRSATIAFMVFTGVFVAFAGGFIMIWLFAQPWFFDFQFIGNNLREVFQMKAINLSVAVWVGFLALFGIATDDGVLVATYLKDNFKDQSLKSIDQIRNLVVNGGLKRVRPAMMTTATTILALLPILSSAGRGADIMIPMAIPSFGGMMLQIITMFTVPVLFSLWKEMQFKFQKHNNSIS